jgi:putative peptide zinc metalloprotease protein
MSELSLDMRVQVPAFKHRQDGDDAIIGNVERDVFLAIPIQGLQILQSLAAGRTVGETVQEYESRYGETPDIDDFLQVLKDEGFLADEADEADGAGPPPGRTTTVPLNWPSQRTARLLVSGPVLILCAIIIVTGFALVVADPYLIPGPQNLLYPEHFAALTWATAVFTVAGIAFHELAHGVAARAAGVPVRIGLGNRMYFLVAETDMSAIWLAPKRQRYRAFLIGWIADFVEFSVIVYFLSATKRGLIDPPHWLFLLGSGVLLTVFTRVMWQFFLFLRTDWYYVIATAFNAKNLMADTESYLRSLVARVLLRPSRRGDFALIPRRERWVIRVYSLFWLFGRVLALALLFLIGVPLIYGYAKQAGLFLTGGKTHYNLVDFLTIVAVTAIFNVGGFFLWLRHPVTAIAGRLRGTRRESPGEFPAGVEAPAVISEAERL